MESLAMELLSEREDPCSSDDFLYHSSSDISITELDPMLPDVALDINLQDEVVVFSSSEKPLGMGSHGRCACPCVIACSSSNAPTFSVVAVMRSAVKCALLGLQGLQIGSHAV